MYTQPSVQRRTRWDEVGFDMMITSGPPMTGDWWPNVWVYYWAMQMIFLNDDGVQVGGGHAGIQAYDHFLLRPAGWKPTVVNWGVYDDTFGDGEIHTFRTSEPLTPDLFFNINAGPSWGFDWSFNEWLRFRVFKSPKQDWTADRINPGDNQVPPYVDTDQQADETAFRCTVQYVTRGLPPIPMWDVLVKDAAASKPMGDGVVWTEALPYAEQTGNILTDWYYSPAMRFRNVNHDGYRMQTSYEAFYPQDAGGVDLTANCDIRAVNASGGDPGYFAHIGGTTRTTAHHTILPVPTGFWDDPQPNVAPAPSDLSPRVATPRPWF